MNYLFIDDPENPMTENQNQDQADANTGAQTLQPTDDPIEATETTNQQAGGGGSFWIMMIIMIALMYFLMWRPESKRRKKMEEFRKNLKKGDKIITAGGIYGTIKEVHETTLLIEVDSNVTLRIDKSMVAAAPLA